MLYKFKSRATADLILLEPQARRLLHIMGKEPAASGIFTVAQTVTRRTPAISSASASAPRPSSTCCAAAPPKATMWSGAADLRAAQKMSRPVGGRAGALQR